MTTVAVTGATGFIGRHVLKELAGRDVEVIATTRSDRDDLPAQANLRWVTLDLACPPDDAFEQLGRPDVLIHLAWGGLPNYRALRHFEVELPLHYAFLRQLIDEGLKSLVVTGTCLEYGLRAGALSESLVPEPVTPYGFAKDTLRRQLEYLHRSRDAAFDLTWARLFYTYGDGQAHASLLPQLRSAVEQGLPAFRMSGGEQLRDYLPVADVARNLVALAVRGKGAGMVNVCAGAPVSVRRLVEQWLREHRWNIELDLGHYPYPDYEPLAFWGDRSKLAGLLENS
ncbi:NAD-dependent epimerase/dehydratase family protein [Paraburkholderia sp. HD33-4]|uniref:NAD-dependent epimerase/dehydratase family protein n=1 Tax=Paraburkholderia sp. HD33-4 TaxID=2883242 RepID=UPI001F45D52C|nr:NAD(P)-dependent oxidoreductase [Paraburkholderia sp. HD33-4]